MKFLKNLPKVLAVSCKQETGHREEFYHGLICFTKRKHLASEMFFDILWLVESSHS